MYNHPALWRTAFLGNGYAPFPHFGLVLLLVVLWSLAWKGWALWLAARRHEKAWFIILLIVNTIGILEIIYIFAVAKQKDVKTTTAPPQP